MCILPIFLKKKYQILGILQKIQKSFYAKLYIHLRSMYFKFYLPAIIRTLEKKPNVKL